MATIKQGILGGFSGKVGTVVGSSWNGVSYIKAQAQNVKNPRTAKQMAQREKFALAQSFLRPMQSFIKIGYKQYALHQTAYNAAMSYTLKNAIKGSYPNQSIDYTSVMVSRGSLMLPPNVQKVSNDGEIAISWTDNSGLGNASDTDLAMPLAYNETKHEVIYDFNYSCRGDEGVSLAYPTNWTGDTVHIYLTFVSDDGTLVADSIYVGSQTIA